MPSRRVEIPLCVLFGCCIGLLCESSPVLVLVANGSDITINFPGENNNNRLFSIVSGSGNNNPSMLDWIGGNGANKAPTITQGQSNASPGMRQIPPPDDGSQEDDDLSTTRPRWGPLPRMGEVDETDDVLPYTTQPIPTNSTTVISAAVIDTTDGGTPTATTAP